MKERIQLPDASDATPFHCHTENEFGENTMKYNRIIGEVDMYQAINVSLISLSVLIVFANGTVIGLILGTRQLRTPSNLLIMSLALSDLLIGAVLLPVQVAAPTSPLNGYITAIILLSGVGSVCGISYDRYTAVIRPFQHRIILKKYFSCMISIIWSLPIVISLAPLLWKTNSATSAHRVYLVLLCVVFVIGPYLVVFTMYCRIFTNLKKNTAAIKRMRVCTYVQRKAKRISSEKKVTKVFFLLVIMFLVSWSPVLYSTLAFAAGRLDVIPSFLDVVSLYTLSLISLVNPVLYSLSKKGLKREFKRLLCRTELEHKGAGRTTTPSTDEQDTLV